MATLQQCIDEIQDVVGAISGIRAAPDEPPDQINAFPVSLCFASSGYYQNGPPELLKGLHDITLRILWPRKDLEHDVSSVMPYANAVANALYGGIKDSSFTAIETFEQVSYTFGEMDWGGFPVIGFDFLVERVKQQNAIS